jgi:hypothetical protein
MAKGGMEKVKLSGDMLVRHTNLVHRNDGFSALLGVAITTTPEPKASFSSNSKQHRRKHSR